VIPHPTPIRLTSPPATFSYSSRWNTAEKASFWHDWEDPPRIARSYRYAHVWELPGMHEIMGNTLGSLYKCPRGLIRRRRWKLGVTVRNFFMIKFPEILVSPTYTTGMYQAGIQLKRNCFLFAFGKYSLRISTGTPSTHSDISFVFIRCLQANDRTLLKVTASMNAIFNWLFINLSFIALYNILI
jgi:hypothetical protein